MLDLVIFDADGVLFESDESNIAYYNAIFERVGEAPLDQMERKACIYYSAGQVFALRSAGDAKRLERMREVARTMDSTPFFRLLRPVPGLREFLVDLKQRYRLGLATNRSATIPAVIDHVGLTGIFDAIASARDKVRPKPAPDILQLCLERAQVSPQQAVYVGDSETDRIAAEEAGTHFIGLGDRAPHHHWIASLTELPAKLKENFN
jgi:HAD superfamily hydrolase (TIGR01509 family)